MDKVAIGVEFRSPRATDGRAVNQLIERCPPLDTNSLYCNLLQCSHFASTSVAAEVDQRIVGFVSGYCIPDRPEVLFIWQVAVDASMRGQGLAKRMIKHILSRAANSADSRADSRAVSQIETTITQANESSWAMFKSLARDLDAGVETQTMFDKQEHFAGGHDTEVLVRIGPFQAANLE